MNLNEKVKVYKQRSFPRERKVASLNARAVRLQGQRLRGNVPLPRTNVVNQGFPYTLLYLSEG